jgi:hypothetical protein
MIDFNSFNSKFDFKGKKLYYYFSDNLGRVGVWFDSREEFESRLKTLNSVSDDYIESIVE